MSTLQEEISRRRTFAIISHPDAGKTTLTEKFLLYGGAIAQAGVVKGKKNSRAATSDWMEIEKQRGISVTSSVMQFQYEGFCINILDTPGHQDFSEDTYRTLMAADSAVMVIDAAKGVEAQTIKLFKVCTLRHIPIFTFINKMDREARDPFELMENIEEILGIKTYPMNWPIGSGKDFQGVYDREKSELLFFSGVSGKNKAGKHAIDLYDPQVAQLLDSEEKHRQLIDDVELLSAGREMDMEEVRRGQLSPVFFGSALTNFGIEPFLESFLKLTPPPLARVADCGTIDPFSPDFSAFVFKIQANMNKAHRDRLAFMRICSGKFQRDAEYFHVQGNRKMRLSQPQQMMAAEREIVDEAYAGDVIGVFDPGIFSIGDTITVPGKKFSYSGIPTFAPEHFARVSAKDSMKRKQFQKGITQLAEEGAIQTFIRTETGREEFMVGVVGVLQFEVLEHRLKTEYQVDIVMESMPFRFVRWVVSTPKPIDQLKLTSTSGRAKDSRDRDVLLFENEWSIRLACENNAGLELAETANRK